MSSVSLIACPANRFRCCAHAALCHFRPGGNVVFVDRCPNETVDDDSPIAAPTNVCHSARVSMDLLEMSAQNRPRRVLTARLYVVLSSRSIARTSPPTRHAPRVFYCPSRHFRWRFDEGQSINICSPVRCASVAVISA